MTSAYRRLKHILPLLLVLCFMTAPAVAEDIPSPEVPLCTRVDDAYFSDAVLVGDSLADGLALHNVIPELMILSRIGLSPRTALTDTSFKHGGKPVTIVRKLAGLRPGAIYIWLGSNGLDAATGDAEQVSDEYDRLIGKIRAALPDTPLYLLEVTPVMTLEAAQYATFTNEKIDAFNEALREIAIRHKAHLLPVNALLRDAEGLLDAQYAAKDGIHLQKAAYETLADYLYTHALALETPADMFQTPDSGVK